MNKVAVLYICTGQYNVFWKIFYHSFKKHFLKKSSVEYFVFTDDKELEYGENADVHVIEQEKYEWPFSTLLRFDIFSKVEDQIRKFDYCFFFNANMMCLQDISEEEFLPINNDLLVAEHPGHYRRKLSECNWERNPLSTAYIEKNREKVYVQGALNGGKANAFMDMVLELKNNTQKDLNNGIIALVHDESHLNRYILNHPNYKLLSSAYLYPEAWSIPEEQKIIQLDKARYINVGLIKNGQCSEKEYGVAIKNESKWMQNYEIVKELLVIEKLHMNLKSFFAKRNINRIAIYGYKNLGEILIESIKDIPDQCVEVKYIIDRNCRKLSIDNAILPEQISEMKDTDCIIVSAVHEYANIWDKLSNVYDKDIFSLAFVVHEVYLQCINNSK